MNSENSPESPHSKALRIGTITGVLVLLVVFVGGLASDWGARGGNANHRGEAIGNAACLLAFWSGLAAYGVARLLLRSKAPRPDDDRAPDDGAGE